MGQKVHPYGFRLGITKDWLSKWIAKPGDIAKLIYEDHRIREYINERFKNAAISKIEIRRTRGELNVTIHTARPGMVVGRRGASAQKLEEELKVLAKETSGKDVNVNVEVREIAEPDLDAFLVAQNIARQIERRVFYRRVMKQAVMRAMQAGAVGVKVQCKGRLAGAEIARKEWYSQGKLALGTLTADIDYAHVPAVTRSGVVGVKVWINKGRAEVRKYKKEEE